MSRSVQLVGSPLIIAFVALGFALLFLRAESRVGFGFPIDDGWIHAQFARNLANGHGLSYNPGEPSTGSTAPFWTVLLAIPVAFGVSVVVAAKAVGILLAVATAILAGRLAGALTGSRAAALVAGIATAASARLTWGAVAGMEVPLYTVLTCAALLAFVQRRQPWVWGLLCGLSTLARPETGVLFPVLAGVALLGDTPTRARLRALVPALVAFVAVVGIDVGVNLWISGRPLPSTFYAKTEGAGLLNAVVRADADEAIRSTVKGAVESLNLVIRYFVEQSAFLFLFLLPGLLVATGLWRAHTEAVPGGSQSEVRRLSVPLVLLASPLAVGALAPVSPLLMQEGRYVSHLLVLFFVLSAVGADALARQVRASRVVWAVAALAVVRLASQDAGFADRYARQVDNINRMHVEMGRWLASNTPPGATIATNDIGALAFFSGRRILDLEGLVTPEIIPFRRSRDHLAFLEQARPAYVVMFDEWYPHLAARRDLFKAIHRITVPRVTAAHDTFVVYRTAWATPDASFE